MFTHAVQNSQIMPTRSTRVPVKFACGRIARSWSMDQDDEDEHDNSWSAARPARPSPRRLRCSSIKYALASVASRSRRGKRKRSYGYSHGAHWCLVVSSRLCPFRPGIHRRLRVSSLLIRSSSKRLTALTPKLFKDPVRRSLCGWTLLGVVRYRGKFSKGSDEITKNFLSSLLRSTFYNNFIIIKKK